MNKINRNSPCPCGSGKKYKRCCDAENLSPLHGMTPGLRMKGGICYDDDLQAFVPIVHIWQNIHCDGEPQEWRVPKGFQTEDEAMNYYKTYIRPELQKLMNELESKNK